MSTPIREYPRLYRLVRGAVRLYFLLYHRFRVEGADHIPSQGGCIVACNHVSFLDPPAVACGIRHRMPYFLARRTLWDHSRFSRWFLSHHNCIPVNRDRGDIGALRTAVRVLRQGKVLALFPEGTRSTNGDLQVLHGGVGYVATQAGVPVVPAYVDGAYKAFPRGSRFVRPVRIHIRYGTPILPTQLPSIHDRKQHYLDFTRLIMNQIRGLKP